MKKTKRVPKKEKGLAVLRAAVAPVRSVLPYAAACFFGFLLCNARIADGMSPFAVGLTAAVVPGYELFTAAGTAIGSLVFGDLLSVLKYGGCAVLLCAVRFALQKKNQTKFSPVFPTVSSGVCLLACGAAVELARGITPAGIALCLCESVLGAAAAFLAYCFFSFTAPDRRPLRTDVRQSICLLAVCGTVLLALMPVQPYGFPVAMLLSGLTVLIWAYCAGETGGCLAGVCCGCIAGLAENGSHAMLAGAMGGLIAGLCMPAGRLAAALGYTVACLLALTVNGSADSFFPFAAAAAAAGLLFVILPKRWLERLRPAVFPQGADRLSEQTRRLVSRQLAHTGEAVRTFSETVSAVSEKIQNIGAPREQEILHRVRSRCCADCPRLRLCWDHSLASLRPVLLQAQQRVQQDGLLTRETLPDRLTAVCRNSEQLIAAFNDAYARQLQRTAQNKEVLAAKRLASAQLRTAADLLEDLAENGTGGKAEGSIAAAVQQSLTRAGIGIEQVNAQTDAQEHLFVYLTFEARPTRGTLKEVGTCLAQQLGFPFAAPVRCGEHGREYCFYEAPPFAVQLAHEQFTGANERVCGDTESCFRDAKGHFVMLLSDGMGTGERAALDSLMTCSLAETLLKAGISPTCTAEMVNAALLLRCAQESMATLDIAVIDLFTGRTRIYKAGASFSVLQAGSRTAVIEQQSLPLGILNETRLSCSEFCMVPGDVLFLLSDGACNLPTDYFKSLHAKQKAQPLSETVTKLTRDAALAGPGSKSDDVTCLAAKLVRTPFTRTLPVLHKEKQPSAKQDDRIPVMQ